MEHSDFLELNDVTIEFDDHQTHEVYFESHFFFAHIENGTSTLIQFIPLIKNGIAHPTFLDGARLRIDGEVFITLDHRWETFPIFEYGHEPPFDPIIMGVYVHRIYPLSDVNDPFPDTVWRNVPGTAHRMPDNDPQLRQVAHGRKIAKMLASYVKNLNAVMEEGLSESDVAGDIAGVQELITYNLLITLKNTARKHIGGE